MWKCKYDCGKYRVVEGYKLRIDHTTSCGCAKKELNIQHIGIGFLLIIGL